MKSLLAQPLCWRLLSPLLRPDGITVLMYHSVYRGPTPFEGMAVERFRPQMEWLANNCAIVDPDEFETVLARRNRFAKPPVMLTFDDGYRDYHDVAYPILHSLHIPALLFICTGLIDDGGTIWTEELQWAARTTTKRKAALPWDASQIFTLETDRDRQLFLERCRQHLKGIPSQESTHLQKALLQELAVDSESLTVQRRMLNWDEVRAVSEFTRFGGHTHTHPILSQVSSECAEAEITKARDRIAEETGVGAMHFAYPNGERQDFTEQTKDLVRKSGYRFGYSSISGVQRRDMDEMEIRRQPTGAARPGDFAWLVAGASVQRQ